MNVLIACEFSGIVRNAFKALGHHTISVDLLKSEDSADPLEHHVMDIEDFIEYNSGTWDLVIAHPPCTHLATSGARWFSKKQKEQKEAVEFVEWIWDIPTWRLAIENPVGVLSTKSRLGKPSQIIQPWQFGHPEVKATCLWLKNLPPLKPTNIVSGRVARVHHEPPGPDQWKNRSRTLPGIAAAMASQWGSL